MVLPTTRWRRLKDVAGVHVGGGCYCTRGGDGAQHAVRSEGGRRTMARCLHSCARCNLSVAADLEDPVSKIVDSLLIVIQFLLIRRVNADGKRCRCLNKMASRIRQWSGACSPFSHVQIHTIILCYCSWLPMRKRCLFPIQSVVLNRGHAYVCSQLTNFIHSSWWCLKDFCKACCLLMAILWNILSSITFTYYICCISNFSLHINDHWRPFVHL